MECLGRRTARAESRPPSDANILSRGRVLGPDLVAPDPYCPGSSAQPRHRCARSAASRHLQQTGELSQKTTTAETVSVSMCRPGLAQPGRATGTSAARGVAAPEAFHTDSAASPSAASNPPIAAAASPGESASASASGATAAPSLAASAVTGAGDAADGAITAAAGALSPQPPPPTASRVCSDAGRCCLDGCSCCCGCSAAVAGGGLTLVSVRPRSLCAPPPPHFFVLTVGRAARAHLASVSIRPEAPGSCDASSLVEVP